MHNYFHFFGRLVSDIEVTETSKGKMVGDLRIAVKREFKNFNGEYDTDFMKITLWEGVAINASQYLKKGDQVLVSGRVSTSKYDLGEDKYLNTVELIGEKVTFVSNNKNN